MQFYREKDNFMIIKRKSVVSIFIVFFILLIVPVLMYGTILDLIYSGLLIFTISKL